MSNRQNIVTQITWCRIDFFFHVNRDANIILILVLLKFTRANVFVSFQFGYQLRFRCKSESPKWYTFGLNTLHNLHKQIPFWIGGCWENSGLG